MGSGQGSPRQAGTAQAAQPPALLPAQPEQPVRSSTRGPVAPALQRLGTSDRFGDPGDVDPPSWSRPAAACAMRSSANAEITAGDGPLAGLRMPSLHVPQNPQVLRYVRYFTEHHEGRAIFAEALRRSGRFQEIIAASLRELGLPQDLIAVAFIESGFSADAISTAGAAGLWQLMPATARAYGLAVESTIDERVSIWRSTNAAVHHLADLHERFRSWELALAAYNLGFDGLDRRLDDYGVDDFWALAESPGALPKETVNYVPKVLAAAVVFANLEKFGFGDVERAPPIDAAELEVSGGTSLALVARAAGTSLRVLHELNPELLADVVPGRGAPTMVHVPSAGIARARAMMPGLANDTSPAMHVSEDFDWGKDDEQSGSSRLERTATHTTGTSRLPPRRHRRKPLAARLQDAASKFLAVARDAQARADAATQTTPQPDPTPPASDKSGTHVVRRVVAAGDSVRQIAASFGLTLDQLLAQAHVTSAEEIKVGAVLELRVPDAR